MEPIDDPAREGAPNGARESSRPAREWGDAALVDAMRRREAGAFREFFERFYPLLIAVARASGVPPHERDECATELLEDIAIRLLVPGMPVPRSIASYLAASLRRRTRNVERDRRCRERLRHAYAVQVGTDMVVPTATSEYTLRASRGPVWDARGGLSPAVERLAVALERRLGADERQLLAWLAQRVPQREIAGWLGTTHAAVRVRVARLRARLRDAALRYASRLDAVERAEVDRFFRRIDIPWVAGVTSPRDGSPDGGSPR